MTNVKVNYEGKSERFKTNLITSRLVSNRYDKMIRLNINN